MPFSFLTVPSLSLFKPGRRYEFMIKSWANGTEHRRVFVLEQVGACIPGGPAAP